MSFYAFKGFDKDLKCRDFQYEVGKTYSIPEKPEVCKRGFHCCTKLSDVFCYYEPWIWQLSDSLPQKKTLSDKRFCVVEVLGEVSVKPDTRDSKLATNKIAIVRELHLPEMQYIIEHESEIARIKWIYSQHMKDMVKNLVPQ